ncbi:ZmaE [Thermobacillus xylanilyticus]|jgi:hypothetical protein|uniref:ZmaE n=1 Tax=Thermobacillus xylanilyticus TaxID=76633 RepID=A0ABM8V4P1_THEXY|nr:acyl-CoA dehydrogenase family protein [Thermobacillus xylanilyticus]REJ12359.1 MAG: acyl-CoA dehydrogenase [Paenibacillaceae bacterium]CAG5087379.1 ZmaE [Thermobacillus xylanilyticus]
MVIPFAPELVSSEHAQILEEAEGFVNAEIRPFVQEWERKDALPKALIRKMGERGYLAASLPRKYGGLELEPVAYGLFTEIFGRACPAVRSLITVHTSLVSETLLRFGTDKQKEVWLPRLAQGEAIAAFALTEPEVGSDARNVRTTWREEADAYVLKGVKKWITFGDIADLFIVIAAHEGKSTAFLVERSSSGLQTKHLKGLMAGHATHIAEIRLEEVRVPRDNVLGRLHGGFEYIVSAALDQGRYSIAWAGVGLAQEALNAMVAYARNREQFGRKLSQHQLIRGLIGNAVTDVHAARALCLRAGELRRKKNPEAVMETTIAKYFASRAAVRVANDALQVHGANGFSNQYPVERLYREAKVLEIIEGTSQMQQEVISHFGLKHYYQRSLVP